MHCFCRDLGVCGKWIRDVITTIGVPFFFITSGYFFSKGFDLAQDKKLYVSKYVKRILVMYSIWTVVTLPVAWMNLNLAKPDEGLIMRMLRFPRGYFLSGSMGIYWYLLSLIYGAIIIGFSQSKQKIWVIFGVASIFFIIGVMYEGGALGNSLLYKIIHTVFGSERNFLNVGIFYMSVGFLAQRQEGKLSKNPVVYLTALIVSIAVDTCLRNVTSLHFMQAFSAFSLFNLSRVITISIPDKIALKCRTISTVIYLSHFPLILVFDYYLQRGTFIDIFTVLSISICVYIIAKKVLPGKIIKAVYGN